MIEIKELRKSFGTKQVINGLSLTINDGEIFGLVGINGAGKSTLLRLISGIYLPDNGSIKIDGMEVFDNPKAKRNIFILPDDPYYPKNSTIQSVLSFYKSLYEINEEEFNSYIKLFGLKSDNTINNFSKGMKRQLFIALALAICPKYLLLDEAFDGLDPLVRLKFRKIISRIIEEKNITIIISSHSLRELEDICDSYGLLDGGVIEKTGSIEERKNIYHKFQIAFNDEMDFEVFKDLDIVSFSNIGRVIKLIVRGDKEKIVEYLSSLKPLLIDEITIDFEELFIIEAEERGYIAND